MDIETYMRENAITQITVMDSVILDDTEHPQQYSVVIGNNRYFGLTIEEAVRKAQ